MSAYSEIFERVILPTVDTIRSRNDTAAFGFLMESQYWSRDRLNTFVSRQLRQLIVHAYEHVPYYREAMRWSGIRPEDIQSVQDVCQLPILEKAQLRNKPEALLASVTPAKQPRWELSSGTTGEPVRFVVCPRSLSWGWAATYRHYRWSGVRLGEPILVLWGAAGERTRRGIDRTFSDLLWRRRRLPAELTSGEDLQGQVRFAQSFKPALLRGYATALYRFAQKVDAIGVQLPSIKCVSSTAEPISERQRRYVGKVLNAEVLSQYGCREVVGVACECIEQKSMHVAEERVLVESTAPPGQEGDLLLTDLHNYTMPLIRYRIGDRAILGQDTCPCGRQHMRIESLEGRTSETIDLPDGRSIGFAYISRYFNEYAFIERYQVAQVAPARLEVRLEHHGSMDDVEKALAGLKRRLGTSVQVVPGKGIEPSASGKHLVVRSLESGN